MRRVGGDVHAHVAQRELVVAEPAGLGPEDDGAGARRPRARAPPRPARAASRPRVAAGPTCPRRASLPATASRSVGARTRAVEHVPGAVGERARLRRVEAGRRHRRAPASAGPCSSWRGRPRRRWPAAPAARARRRRATRSMAGFESSPLYVARDEAAAGPCPAGSRACSPRPSVVGLARADGAARTASYPGRAPPTWPATSSRYGSAAQWKGIYYRGEKIGFTVGADGAHGRRLRAARGRAPPDGAARRHHAPRACTPPCRVDKAFALRSFPFSLDPGTGPIEVEGTLDGRRLELTVKTPAGTRTETRELAEPPALSLNLLAPAGRGRASRRASTSSSPSSTRPPCATRRWSIDVEAREVVRAAGRPVPAFRVATRFAGITSTSWITDIGEVVREESPMGLIVVKETPERATGAGRARRGAERHAGGGRRRARARRGASTIPRAVRAPARAPRRRRPLRGPTCRARARRVTGDVVEIARRARRCSPEPRDPDLARYLRPEPFIESDAPEIVAEAREGRGRSHRARAAAPSAWSAT